MLDFVKFSKKNKIYNYFIKNILRIDIHLLSKNFYHKENFDLKFNEDYLYEYRKKHTKNRWTNRPNITINYQSEHNLNKDKVFRKQIIELENYLNTKIKPKILNINTFGNFRIKSMWFSIQKKNEIHPSHNHPKAVLSGVYYIKIDKNSGGAININLENEKIKHTPEKNDLLIFDSNTYHSVDTYNGENDRISVAWDAIYSF